MRIKPLIAGLIISLGSMQVLAEENSEFVSFSSLNLPAGMVLTIDHKFDQEIFPNETEYKVSQAYYNHMIYEFKFDSGLKVLARTYLDDIRRISIQGSFLNGERREPYSLKNNQEFRAAVLTLLAFDYDVEYFGEEGYKPLSLKSMNLDLRDIISWKQELNSESTNSETKK